LPLQNKQSFFLIRPVGQTPVVAIANQKGGVGKTTTAINLSAALARLGHRVLLLDLDPQANATSGLGFTQHSGTSCYTALLGEEPLESKIRSTHIPGLDLIPSEMDMCGVEVELTQFEDYVLRLRQALAPLRDQGTYQLIFIDCPPSLGVLTVNALAAADSLLVPIQCEYYALEGISLLMRLVDQIRDSGINPQLRFLGLVLTMHDARTRLSHQVSAEVRNYFKELVFDTIIPRTTRLAEAPSHGKPILEYDPYSVATAAYEVLAQEVAARLGLATDASVTETPPRPTSPYLATPPSSARPSTESQAKKTPSTGPDGRES